MLMKSKPSDVQIKLSNAKNSELIRNSAAMSRHAVRYAFHTTPER